MNTPERQFLIMINETAAAALQHVVPAFQYVEVQSLDNGGAYKILVTPKSIMEMNNSEPAVDVIVE